MHKLSATEKKKLELKNPPEEDPEFQIAPMIDILLVLLVFFMSISSTEILQTNKDVVLPVAETAKDAGNTPGQIIVNVTWLEAVGPVGTGGIIVGETPYKSPDDLINILNRAVIANPMVRVLVRADRQVRWEYLKEVLRSVGDAGIANITFSVVNQEKADAS